MDNIFNVNFKTGKLDPVKNFEGLSRGDVLMLHGYGDGTRKIITEVNDRYYFYIGYNKYRHRGEELSLHSSKDNLYHVRSEKYGICTTPVYKRDGSIKKVTESTVKRFERLYSSFLLKQIELKNKEEKRSSEILEKGKKIFESMNINLSDYKGYIVATEVIDDSDIMTDYFNSKSGNSYLLGFSKSNRHSFKELREMSLKHEVSKHLYDADEKAEHRENYSMGAGYYLKNGYRHSTGVEVRKNKFYSGYSNSDLNRIYRMLGEGHYAPNLISKVDLLSPSIELVAVDFKVTFNEEKNGIEIAFNKKPDSEVLSNLKSNGFRWSSRQKIWYSRKNANSLNFVEQLKSGV